MVSIVRRLTYPRQASETETRQREEPLGLLGLLVAFCALSVRFSPGLVLLPPCLFELPSQLTERTGSCWAQS